MKIGSCTSDIPEKSEVEYPDSRCIVVSRDKLTRRQGGIEIIYVFDFLRMLWNDELVQG